MTSSLLDELESQVTVLAPDSTKHDMEPGFEAMATWLEHQPSDLRSAVVAALPAWLTEESHPWHSRAALELALRLREESLLESAVRLARNRGVPDLTAEEKFEYPGWLIFALALISTISRWAPDHDSPGRAYLRELQAEARSASSYPKRLLGIRAWFTECLLQPTRRKACLVDGLKALRSWRDPRLLRSGLTLLHAYFASASDTVSDLREILTPEEFAIAWSELNAST